MPQDPFVTQAAVARSSVQADGGAAWHPACPETLFTPVAQEPVARAALAALVQDHAEVLAPTVRPDVGMPLSMPAGRIGR